MEPTTSEAVQQTALTGLAAADVVPTWVWLATIGAIGALFVFDFVTHVRKPHEPTFRESALWSTFYIVLALIFGGGVYYFWDAQHGVEYFAGFITEKSLSVDNLFVFVIIMKSFRVPAAYQQKALLIGIVLAHAELVAERTGRAPVLLLDEVAAHLDPGRRAALFARLDGRGQTWMTGTEAALFADLSTEATRIEL